VKRKAKIHSKKKHPLREHWPAQAAEVVRPLGEILLSKPRNAVEQRKAEHFTNNQAKFVASFCRLGLHEKRVRFLIPPSRLKLGITLSTYRYAITRLGKPDAEKVLKGIFDEVVHQSKTLAAVSRPRKTAPKELLRAASLPPGISDRAGRIPVGKGIVHYGQGQTRKPGSNRSPS
jgi:hypothetical protein